MAGGPVEWRAVWCSDKKEVNFWCYLPDVKNEFEIEFQYERVPNQPPHTVSWARDKVKYMGGGWWKVGLWAAAGQLEWAQICLVAGVEVVRFRGPAQSEIREDAPDVTWSPKAPPGEHLVIDLYQRMFESEAFTDMVFVVADGERRAHKAVLAAASPAFAGMLSAPMQEANGGEARVELPEVKREVLQIFLRMVYTGHVEPADWGGDTPAAQNAEMPLPTLLGVVALAHKYLVVEVLEPSTEALKSRLEKAIGSRGAPVAAAGGAAPEEQQLEHFELLLACAIRLDIGALRFRALRLAEANSAVRMKYEARGFRPEVIAELQGIWPPPQPSSAKRARLT